MSERKIEDEMCEEERMDTHLKCMREVWDSIHEILRKHFEADSMEAKWGDSGIEVWWEAYE